MAFDVEKFVSTRIKERTSPIVSSGGFDVNAFVASRVGTNIKTPAIAKLERLAKAKKVEIPTGEIKPTLLERGLDILRTGEYAIGGILAGKSPLAGIREKISPSEALGITTDDTKFFSAKGIVGLAADILFDPVTYLTLGFGAGAKIGTKVLNKTGQTLFKKLAKDLGEEGAKKMMAQRITEVGGEAFVDAGGLKFIGKELLKREKMLFPVKATDELIAKSPVLGAAYREAKKLLGEAFIPFKEIQELPRGVGEEYITLFGKVTKQSRAEIHTQVKTIIDLGRKAEGLAGKQAGELVTEAIETGKVTGNKVIDDMVNYFNLRHKEILTEEMKRGLIKTELPNYMRHFLTPEGQKYLDKGGDIMNTLPKPLRIKLGSAKPRKIAGTIKEINDNLRDKIGGNLFEPDAFKALGARTAESIKAIRTFDFFQEISTRFGRPVVNNKFDDFVDGVHFMESKVPQLRNVLLPEPIVKHLDETYQFLTNDNAVRGFLKIYDGVLNFWKSSVTGWFPAFHTRNFTGGVFNNWLAGVKDPTLYKIGNDIARGVEGTVTTRLGTKLKYSEILDEASKLGVLNQPGYLDVMRNIEDELGTKGISKVFGAPRTAMEFVENRLRLPLFIQRRILGDVPEEAAAKVFKFHFDYAPEGLTAFERNVARRLIPFYRWTRGNIPLQLEQMIKQPGKYAGFDKLLDHFSGKDAQKEKEVLPRFMRENLPVRISTKEGASQWITNLGLPVSDINNLWAGNAQRTLERFIGSYLSPILKAPIEIATGKNLFMDKEIDDLNWVHPYVSKIPGLRQWLEIKPQRSREGKVYFITQNPTKLYLLNLFAGRFYSTVGKVSEAPTLGQTLLKIFAPFSIGELDIQKETKARQRERQEEIEKSLMRAGELKEFSKIYVPK